MNEQKQTPEGLPQASGNIWGWKFSVISLIFILSFLGLAAFRHWQLGIPFDLKNLLETPAQDSTLMNNERMNNERMNNDTLQLSQ